jgi:hypothetical protein
MWTPIAESPIGGRNADSAAIAWTGTEMLVWGGRVDDSRGAAYNPATNRWRELSPSPLSPRRGAAFEWTGSELLIWGGLDRSDPTTGQTYATNGAAYDPRTDTWRLLPLISIPGRQVSGVWTGTEFVILGGVSYGSFGGSPFLHETVAAYDPTADRWRELPRGWSQPGLHNVLVGRLITSWDGKFELALDLDTGNYLEIVRDGPDLGFDDRVFAIANGVASAGVRDTTTNPRAELWLAVRS